MEQRRARSVSSAGRILLRPARWPSRCRASEETNHRNSAGGDTAKNSEKEGSGAHHRREKRTARLENIDDSKQTLDNLSLRAASHGRPFLFDPETQNIHLQTVDL